MMWRSPNSTEVDLAEEVEGETGCKPGFPLGAAMRY